MAKKKTVWITLREASEMFNTPKQILDGAVANRGIWKKKRVWRTSAKPGLEKFVFRGRAGGGWCLVYDAQQIGTWCNSRNEYMKNKSISQVANTQNIILDLSKGECVSKIKAAYIGNRKVGLVYDNMRKN